MKTLNFISKYNTDALSIINNCFKLSKKYAYLQQQHYFK